jgi:dUTP pyrophosphatase
MNNEFEQLEQLRNKILGLQETFASLGDEDVDFNEIMKEMDIDLQKVEKEMIEGKTLLPLKYTVIHPEAVHPKYNYETDSGFDLHSVENLEIQPFGRVLVPTGLCFDIRDGFELQIRSKSGLAINQGLMVLNSPGTVDNGYTGEVQVIIFNTNKHSFQIPVGMKIAQAVLTPVVNGAWVGLEQVKEINKKDRNENGFGSTGII